MEKKICKVDECNTELNRHSAKGLCEKHYTRYRKYGNTTTVKRFSTHGMCGTSEYKIWAGMKTRCYNIKSNHYKYYGGRGIKVCDRWKNSFKKFYKDMGKRPFLNAQIDRIDNEGNYEPSNCRWATLTQNRRNRRDSKLTREQVNEIRYFYQDKGRTTQRELSKMYNVSWATIYKIVHYMIWVKK